MAGLTRRLQGGQGATVAQSVLLGLVGDALALDATEDGALGQAVGSAIGDVDGEGGQGVQLDDHGSLSAVEPRVIGKEGLRRGRVTVPPGEWRHSHNHAGDQCPGPGSR